MRAFQHEGKQVIEPEIPADAACAAGKQRGREAVVGGKRAERIPEVEGVSHGEKVCKGSLFPRILKDCEPREKGSDALRAFRGRTVTEAEHGDLLAGRRAPCVALIVRCVKAIVNCYLLRAASNDILILLLCIVWKRRA